MALSVKNSLGGGSIGSVENLLVCKTGTTNGNGVTFTNNGNGTYTVDGTATADTYFTFAWVSINGTYKLCGTPKGGSEGTYYMYVDQLWQKDYGDGKVFTGSGYYAITIIVKSGTVCNNLVFKPMLTTNLKATYKEFVKRVGGFNNLFVPTAPTQTINGVTVTNNGDGTYTANGTASATSLCQLCDWITLDVGKVYKLSGCPSGGGSTSYRLRTYHESSSDYSDYGNGVIFTGISEKLKITIVLVGGYTFNNVIFKPMLTESLLPEYFDFVKGVAEEITPQMFGYTKIDVQTFTVTSNVTNKTITHSLGERPKLVLVFPCEGAIAEANFSRGNLIYAMMRMYQGSSFDSYPAYGTYAGINAASSVSNPKEAAGGQLNGNAFPSTSEVYMRGGGYFLTGYTYKVILMS